MYLPNRELHSFPTRRSSDLVNKINVKQPSFHLGQGHVFSGRAVHREKHFISARRRRIASAKRGRHQAVGIDRKSTRLKSSHVRISYAVFCLKKKNMK